MTKSLRVAVCLSTLWIPSAWTQTAVPATTLAPLSPMWSLMGNGGPHALPGRCDLGIDREKPGDGSELLSIRCANPALPSFGGARKNFDVKPYLGKRVRVSAQLMADDIDAIADPRYPGIAGAAGLWIGVGAPRDGLKSDRMENRAIKGSTGWETREFVVDVPADANLLQAGYWMQGKGQVWMRNLNVEVVSQDVAVNFDRNVLRPEAQPALSLAAASAPGPADIFLPPPPRWLALGEPNFELCDTGIDAKLLASGQRNVSIACKVPVRAYLRHTFDAQPWWGKRVRLSGWLKTEGVEPRVDGGGTPGASLYLGTTGGADGSVHDAVVTGTTDWAYQEVVIDIPVGSASPYIPIGLSLVGTGQVWVKDLRFEEVPRTTLTARQILPSVSNPLSTGGEAERRIDALAQSDRTATARVRAWNTALNLTPEQLQALLNIAIAELRRETEESLAIAAGGGPSDAVAAARLNEETVTRQHQTNLRILEKITPKLSAEQSTAMRRMFEAWVAPRLAAAKAERERVSKPAN